MKQFLYITILSAITLLASCKKNKDQKESESELIGKWVLKNWVSNVYSGTRLTMTDEDNFEPGEYMLFESDGKFIIRIDEEIIQSTWKLLDEGKTLYITPTGSLDIPDDGYEIKTLNSRSLVLYKKEVYGTNSDEITIYLEK